MRNLTHACLILNPSPTPPLNPGIKISALAAGHGHLVVVACSGAVVSFARENLRACFDGLSLPVTAVALGAEHALLLAQDGTILHHLCCLLHSPPPPPRHLLRVRQQQIRPARSSFQPLPQRPPACVRSVLCNPRHAHRRRRTPQLLHRQRRYCVLLGTRDGGAVGTR